MEKWYRKSTGFTLIELMIVILILAVLVAIAVHVYISAINKAKKRTCQANLRAIDGATEVFRATEDIEIYPSDPDELNAYFRDTVVPRCPSGNVAYVYNLTTHDTSCVNSSDHYYP